MNAVGSRARIDGRYLVDGNRLVDGPWGARWPATDADGGGRAVVTVLDARVDGTLVRRRAARAAKVRHPAVRPVRGPFPHGDNLVVVDEIPGIPVFDLERAPLPLDVALGVAEVTARALAACHAVGLVHGDVGCHSVRLGAEGVALCGAGGPGPVRRPGACAPEVALGGPSRESDLYGLGLVLHRLVVGDEAFDAPAPWAAVGAQRRGPRSTGAPLGVDLLLRALLDPNPARRPGDALRVARALGRLRRAPHLPTPVAGARWPRVRLRHTHVVVGVDPVTGELARIDGPMPGRRARRLVGHLRGRGWRAWATREAVGPREVGLALVAVLAAGLAVPLVGGVLVAMIAAPTLAARSRPDVSRLPPLSVPVPPREVAGGGEYAVSAGVLLLLLAASLVWAPLLAPFALGLVAWLAVDAVARTGAQRPSTTAARIALLLAAARRGLDAVHTDAALGLLGEMDAVERAWREGALDDDVALLAVERLALRAGVADVACAREPSVCVGLGEPIPGPGPS